MLVGGLLTATGCAAPADGGPADPTAAGVVTASPDGTTTTTPSPTADGTDDRAAVSASDPAAGAARPSPTKKFDFPDPLAVGDLDPDEEWGFFLTRYRDASAVEFTSTLAPTAGHRSVGSFLYTQHTWTDHEAGTAETRMLIQPLEAEPVVMAKRWVDGSAYIGFLTHMEDDSGSGWVDLTAAGPEALAELGWRIPEDSGDSYLAGLLTEAEPRSAFGADGSRMFEIDVALGDLVEIMDVVAPLATHPVDPASLQGTHPVSVIVDATGRTAGFLLAEPLPPLGFAAMDELMAQAGWTGSLELAPLPHTVRVPEDLWSPTDER